MLRTARRARHFHAFVGATAIGGDRLLKTAPALIDDANELSLAFPALAYNAAASLGNASAGQRCGRLRRQRRSQQDRVRRVDVLKLIEIDPFEEGRPYDERNLNRYAAFRRTGADLDLYVFAGVDFAIVNRARG